MGSRMKARLALALIGAGVSSVLLWGSGAAADEPAHFVNSLGMEMRRIEAGSFTMGSEEIYNEKPVHKVNITKPFYMSATQITNQQYERFAPDHARLRGQHGISSGDDEAVVYVTWHDAAAFCKWLSEKEGAPYRLPTEAEWEYAARAGTATRYNTGDELPSEYHRNQHSRPGVEPVPLHVGTTTPNTWGLYDMHGLVEEWVQDWYGPYAAGEQDDPVGRAAGSVKVSRGGSHGTPVEYLRSATRMGTLPEDKSWLIGFRVVQGELPASEPLPPEEAGAWAREVSQQPHEWGDKTGEPHFAGPRPFVRIPRDAAGPLYSRFADIRITTSHVNHLPAVAWLDNGDLFATWFSSTGSGRHMTIAASRLKAGSDEWTDAGVFFNAPGRNQTGAAMLNDGNGALYWFNGLSAAQGSRENNVLIMSKSADNGRTWTHPVIVGPERNDPARTNQPIDNIDSVQDHCFTDDGRIVIYSDTRRLNGGGTLLQFVDIEDNSVEFSPGTIAGIHARAVKLRDGRMLAVGRSVDDSGPWDADRLPMSVSHDGGGTWEYFDSEFPAISGGQRAVLMRLREGPLLLVSFTGPRDGGDGMVFEDADGAEFRGYGLFGALSFDEGETWPARKLITPADGNTYDGRGIVGEFTPTHTRAELAGYLTATQTPDGVIHLFSSGLHYSFNARWVMTPPAPFKE